MKNYIFTLIFYFDLWLFNVEVNQ